MEGAYGTTDDDATAPEESVSASTLTLTFKLYASLGEYLPPHAENHAVSVTVAAGTSINGLIERFGVPREMAHLPLVNGVFVPPEQRDSDLLNDGDTVAIFPPVAGG